MQAGTLRHRIAIQSATETQNVYGEKIKSWSTDVTVWGSIRPLRGQERFLAQQISPEVTHKIIIRGGQTVTPANRLLFNSRYFYIESPLDADERGIFMELLCKEHL